LYLLLAVRHLRDRGSIWWQKGHHSLDELLLLGFISLIARTWGRRKLRGRRMKNRLRSRRMEARLRSGRLRKRIWLNLSGKYVSWRSLKRDRLGLFYLLNYLLMLLWWKVEAFKRILLYLFWWRWEKGRTVFLLLLLLLRLMRLLILKHAECILLRSLGLLSKTAEWIWLRNLLIDLLRMGIKRFKRIERWSWLLREVKLSITWRLVHSLKHRLWSWSGI